MKIAESLTKISSNNSTEVGNKQKISDSKREQNLKKAQQTAQDFESLFLDVLMKSMRQTVVKEDASPAEEMYQGMMDEELVKSVSQTNQFGIQGMVYEWMKNADDQLRDITLNGDSLKNGKLEERSQMSGLKGYSLQKFHADK